VKPEPLRVLAVVDDDAVARAIAHVVTEDGDMFLSANSVAEAVTMATESGADVAFVELGVEDGAALALCHHLEAVAPGVNVHAIVHPHEIERGGEAMSLGAAGVIVAPPTGDAIARVLAQVKAEAARQRQVNVLEQKLVRERKRLETYDRLVRFARGAAPSDAVRAIVDGVAQLSAAEGVALYATFGKDDSERVLLAALGSALDLPSTSQPADLSRLVQARSARVVPLVAASGELGMLVLDRAPATPEAEIAPLADLAAAMLSLVDKQDHVDESVKIFSPRHFRTVAERMLTLASRHDRRASVLAVSIPGDRPNRREEAAQEISDIVRTTDALCGTEEGDMLIFLPETTGLGAHVCRRRILARLHGERRARPKGANAGPSSNPRSNKSSTVAVGVATFPHDGTSLKRLVKSARARAYDDTRSSVHMLGLDVMSLAEIVDQLIARPILEAGPRSPYPLDIACTALFSLAARACKEGLRGGEANVTTTLQTGLGVAAAARQVGNPRVIDVRAEHNAENIEAIIVEAEHGAWVCCGRVVGERFRGVHAADPLLADVIERRLTAAGGTRAG
jgi:ActR/RegA family two-component response regulator